MATSFLVTVAPESPRFLIEKSKCSLDAKWLVFDRQVCHSSLVAQPPTSRSDVPITSIRQFLQPRIRRSSPQGFRNSHILHSQGRMVNWLFVLDSSLQRRGRLSAWMP